MTNLKVSNSSAIRLNEWRLHENADHISPLQSWGPELRNFRKLPRRPIVHGDCDVIIEKPTFIMKIDASKCNIVFFSYVVKKCFQIDHVVHTRQLVKVALF